MSIVHRTLSFDGGPDGFAEVFETIRLEEHLHSRRKRIGQERHMRGQEEDTHVLISLPDSGHELRGAGSAGAAPADDDD
jgi:hypothetical protein